MLTERAILSERTFWSEDPVRTRHDLICKNCYQRNKDVGDMTHKIDRHFGKTAKVSSQIIPNIYNKLYALHLGGGVVIS